MLTGFTITGGTGTWLLVSWEFKGLRWNRCGGGVICYNMSAPTIAKNIFTNNMAGQGGGIYIYGDPVDPDDPSDPAVHIKALITDNTFTDNSAVVQHGFAPPNTDYPNNDHGDGGAIVAFQGCDTIITGNSIRNNHADMYGGGIHVRQWSNGLLEKNQITANDSALGAGVHITYIASPTVRNNLIEANTASNLGGAGIYVYYFSNPLIELNRITKNDSGNAAAIGTFWESAPTIRNNLIYNNTGGPAIITAGSAPTISHNTIAENHHTAIYCQPGAAPVIENNIIASNGDEYGYGIYTQPGDQPVIRYNNIWGNNAGNYGPAIPDQTGINGNMSVPPGFVDQNNDDYHLNFDSTCINAADPNFDNQDLTDLDGQPRKQGQFADIGADEAPLVWNINSSRQYGNIQHAIDDANNSDVIIVTLGTHTGPGNRDISFDGKAITLRSIDPNARAVVAATIIDSNGSAAEPHRGFHFRDGEDANSVLAGLTITGGAGVYDGGAIKCWYFTSPTIRNCIITNNVAAGRAGGIFCLNNSSPLIDNCTFTDNVVTSGYGGAIACWDYSSPTITNCIITNNHARTKGRHGGGICCWTSSNPVVTNCFVAGNTADHRGGGLYAYWSSPTFINCTVVGNTALEGGGIASFSQSNPTVANCIVRENRSPEGSQIALRVSDTSITTEMTVAFSNIQGGTSKATVDDICVLHWNQGNIDNDPNFANPGFWHDANTPDDPNDDFFVVDDFHLMPHSVCVGTGDNNSVPPASKTDLDSEQRIFGDTVDMGADEVTTNPFDLNNDGIVDYLELVVLMSEWLQAGQLQTDFHEDGFIDAADYAEFAGQWLWKGPWRR